MDELFKIAEEKIDLRQSNNPEHTENIFKESKKKILEQIITLKSLKDIFKVLNEKLSNQMNNPSEIDINNILKEAEDNILKLFNVSEQIKNVFKEAKKIIEPHHQNESEFINKNNNNIKEESKKIDIELIDKIFIEAKKKIGLNQSNDLLQINEI